ncbi:hypothetical protein ACFT9M_12670 [Micromonospora purpureochromogenes]|uniref:hypothetical protein n=1 Tax=Micromonospora purpureochromogenes TaxID=47872 RepID=UPI003644FCC5
MPIIVHEHSQGRSSAPVEFLDDGNDLLLAEAGAEQATRAVCVAASPVAASSATPPSAAVNPRLSRMTYLFINAPDASS